jgi:hypothetical protein
VFPLCFPASFVFPGPASTANAKARAMSKTVTISLCLAALLGGAGLVSAQEKGDGHKVQEQKVVPAPPEAGKTPSEKAGSQAPSPQAQSPAGSSAVLVNGKLAVPGAASDGQAVPSKFSARNAAIDKLSIVAFTLHHLTDEQRREIFGRLHSGRGGLALSPGHAMVGAELPAEIALSALKPVPESLSEKFPELRGTSYLAEEPNVLLVRSNNNVVIGVLSAP